MSTPSDDATIDRDYFRSVSAEVDRIRAEFFRSLSHELRTPLTSILGYAELLLSMDRADLPDDVRDLIKPIYDSGLRLERLVSDLLEIQQLMSATGPAQRRRASMRRVVEDVLIGVDTDGRTLAVEVDDCEIYADPTQIERMIEKLVDNAIKHTHAHSHIVLRARPVRDELLLSVEDDGPGVPDRMKHEIFQPFHQIDMHAAPGAGIGLTLVGLYAELHGGKVWVEDVDGGGARFVVRLPRAISSPDSGAA